MTTSLSSQLENLRTSAARHLTVEKRHISLLFDKKDAGKISNETAFRIGVAGMELMKRIDPIFDTEMVNDLFVEEKINFVRSLLDKDANEQLNVKIEHLLIQLSPYLQHFACQQVLEYLVHTYQIYSYNAEMLILTFLPFHETKVYSRILRILDFDWSRSKEWHFMQNFLKSETPIPFSSIVKATMASSHSIITCITDHIKRAVEIVGSDFLEVKHPMLFNFHAKLMLNLFNDPEKVDEMMLSKMMPFIEKGIKSPMTSFRYTAFMLISQLSLTVKLKEDILNSLCKLLVTKIRPETASSSLETLLVIFQQQRVTSLSNKVLQKLLKIDDEIDIWKLLIQISEKADVFRFYEVLWKGLFSLLLTEEIQSSDSASKVVEILTVTTSHPRLFSEIMAAKFLKIVLEEGMNGNFVDSKKFKQNVHAIGTKFAKQFDAQYEILKTMDKKSLKRVIVTYDLANVVQFAEDIKNEVPKEEAKNVSVDRKVSETVKSLTAAEKAAILAETSEFSKRKVFSGDPFSMAKKWISQKKKEEVEWALNELSGKPTNYFGKKVVEEVETFIVELVKLGINQELVDAGVVKSTLATMPMNELLIRELLTQQDGLSGSVAKKAKTVSRKNPVVKVFGTEESHEEFTARLVFVLEIIIMRSSIPFSNGIMSTLFDIVKQLNSRSDAESSSYQQHLAVNAIRKIFETPVKSSSKISLTDIDMECVIETMRATHSHHLLRDCLRLIVEAAKHCPNCVVKHVMSVFTFMGNGMLRKDNELTLSVVEKTVESLFSTIASSSNENKPGKLIELVGLFAASATDIPAHRRARIAQAIARAVGAKNAATVIMVLMAGFCARWQRTTNALAQEAAKRGSEQDAYDDIAIELLGALSPFEQLSSVLEMVEYVLRLGGDSPHQPPTSESKTIDSLIFDRTTHTLPRIRHFRYVIVTLISRIFANRSLIERLAAYEDEDLLKNALPLGKKLIECSIELDEFANREANKQGENDAQSQRYWVAFASRTEVVSEKLRHLLPGGVAARLIADVLKECVNDKNISYKMCEKVLQLANIKLGYDGYLFVDSGINEKELIALAEALNRFIVPETRSEDRMMLCQNAAYTLKLIAKHLPKQTESNVLADTMQRCVNIVSQYQKLADNLTGNVLLLAGELIRSHNIGSTINHAIALLKTCLAAVQECTTKCSKSQFDANSPSSSTTTGRGNRGQRIRQQSLGGLRFGSDTLLICSLTCIQRIFDQFSSFVIEYSGDVIIRYCRLVSRFGDPTELHQPSSSHSPFNTGGSQTSGFLNKAGIHHRLSLIRRALLTIEIRVLPSHITKAVAELKMEKKSLCALFCLLTGFIENKSQKPEDLRKAIVNLRDILIGDIVTPSLEFRSYNRQLEQFENAETLEKTISNFIIAMAGILSEVEFRPVVNSLVTWAEPGLDKKSGINSRLRLVSLLQFANTLYEAFNSLALPYFGRILEISVAVLKRCNATVADNNDLLLSGKRGTIESLEVNLALKLAIDLIANAARHKDFFTIDRCQMVNDVIIDELVNTKVEGHEKRCSEHLVSAIYRIGNADPDNFGELLNKMMLKTRDSRPKIRYRTMVVFEKLVDKVGDGIQPHLSLLLPFLNELIEDENKQVEAQCQRVINLLQHKFGERFWSGSSV